VRARAVLATAVLLLATACSAGSDGDTGADGGTGAVPAPGDSTIAVDTPDLVALRAAAKIEPCVPGTASGNLPAVTLPCLGGGAGVDLSTLEGPMIINLWASSCVACRVEMPVLAQFHETYAAQVPVLGIDLLDTYPGIALKQARQRGATYPQLADPGGDLLETPAFAKARGLPVLAFVDAAGDVKNLKLGAVTSLEQLVGLVDDALGLDLAKQ
jgi:thiol-disulfide isomerase/thioredoxin